MARLVQAADNSLIMVGTRLVRSWICLPFRGVGLLTVRPTPSFALRKLQTRRREPGREASIETLGKFNSSDTFVRGVGANQVISSLLVAAAGSTGYRGKVWLD